MPGRPGQGSGVRSAFSQAVLGSAGNSGRSGAGPACSRRSGAALRPVGETMPQPVTRSSSTARAGIVISAPARCSTAGASPCSSRLVSTTTS